jgi:hypothetical protein
VKTLGLTVTVEPYGLDYRAQVLAVELNELGASTGELLLATAARTTERDAVIAAVQLAAIDVADELDLARHVAEAIPRDGDRPEPRASARPSETGER